jgi:hypothetical protein
LPAAIVSHSPPAGPAAAALPDLVTAPLARFARGAVRARAPPRP